LIIHGNRFSVVVVDRAGVICSPEMLMYDDVGLTSTFIDAIQQLSSGLDDHQLGFDPTTEKGPHTAGDVFPIYRIQPRMTNNGEPVGANIGELVTGEKPIWASMSLFGRGSAVWRVSSAEAGRVLVMKTAWRHKARTPE
ncbi:hypothetical protein HJC10_45505, partial [Corallococcus exiguus]|nr:hypothetical protein [Corallococcus exiguus]